MKRAGVFLLVFTQDKFVGLLTPRVSTHQLPAHAQGIEPLRWMLGRWHVAAHLRALGTAGARLRGVPRDKGFRWRLRCRRGGITAALAAIPEMDKDSYIRRWASRSAAWTASIPTAVSWWT